MEKINMTNGSKKMLLQFIKQSDELWNQFIDAELFEDFYPIIFELFEFSEEQLNQVKAEFIKRRI
jgi:hypothetical protein